MAPQQTNFGRPDTNADMGNSTRPREFDQKEASDSDGGKQENGKEKEELLAAAEAVWRVSEMARDVFEGELNRRGDALEAAKKAVAEADEAFSNRVSCSTRWQKFNRATRLTSHFNPSLVLLRVMPCHVMSYYVV